MSGTDFGIDVAGNVAEKLVDRIFNLIWNRIARVFKWKTNLKNLEKEVKKLVAERDSVLQLMEAAGRRGEVAGPKVKIWLTKAKECIGEDDEDKTMKKFGEAADKKGKEVMPTDNKRLNDAYEFFKENHGLKDDEEEAKKKCLAGMCCNPRARYKISKKAEKYLVAVTELLQEADKSNFADSYRPRNSTAPVNKGFEDFGSRTPDFDRIMEALRRAGTDKIGVCGMPGVGKTMLAKEVFRRAEEAHLFDSIAFASVGKDPDLKTIRGQIADNLVLELKGETEVGRANQLKAYLKKKERILVILDDIWSGLDLDGLGIPFEDKKNEASSKGEEQRKCKILCTSRSHDVLSSEMDTDQLFDVHPLREEEGWELLKKIVGDKIENSGLRDTAMEIAKECAGLPLAIQTLGTALKYKEHYVWADSLLQLKRPCPENFRGIYAKVYFAIELSYNYLEGEELKQTFLLCSLLGQNADVENLITYGFGLGLFQNVNTIEEARGRVLSLVDRLKSCSMLLDGKSINLHDIVQDVGISIASRDHHVLSLTHDNIPRMWSDGEGMGDVKWIHIEHATISELPNELECPQLTLFHLASRNPSMKIPDNFFGGMPNLRVLNFSRMCFLSMPSSIGLLENLRTLHINHSAIKEIAIVAKLSGLEILSLSRSDIEELPTEIGHLTQLKFLDLNDCTKLKVIRPRVLESLSRLEELYLQNSFNQWDANGPGNQRNASLAELKNLQNLVALDVHACDVQLIPEDLFSERLNRYKIFVGEVWHSWDNSFKSKRILKLELNTRITCDHSICMLLKKTEELHVEKLKGVKNIVPALEVEDFQELKNLYVKNAPEIRHIVNSVVEIPCHVFPLLEVLFLQNLNNMAKICHGQLAETSLRSLRTITIECCNQLESLFPFSIARRLRQLEEIRITNCSNMLEIVDEEGQVFTNDTAGANENILFAHLLSLKLQCLPKFIRLCHGLVEANDSRSEPVSLFNEKIVFPDLQELELSSLNIESIWSSQLSAKSCCFQSLTDLIIEGCDHLKHLLSFSMAKCLVQLRYLQIKRCERMGEIIALEDPEEMEDLILFPRLNDLYMGDLENLCRFCSGNYSIEFTTLKKLFIYNCPELNGFIVNAGTDFTGGIQPLFNEKVAFPSLEQLDIRRLAKLRIIWHHQLPADSFCKLKNLCILLCHNLLNIFPSYKLARLLTSVEELRVMKCDRLEEIFEPGELNVEESHAVVNSPLRDLSLWYLRRLKHLWSKDLCRILTFKNLWSVAVFGCRSLQNIFPASLAKDLQLLQVLKIEYCDVMEEVVALEVGDEAVPRFALPHLSTIELRDLRSLKYFYPRKHITECPKLKDFHASGCGSSVETKGERLGISPIQQLLFSIKVFPKLENLSLTSDDFAVIFDEQFPRDLFCNVKVLRLLPYRDKSPVFSIRFLQCFRKLEKLRVDNVDLEELFPSEGDADGQEKCVGTQLHIRELNLECSNNLRHICNQDSRGADLILQNLKILEVNYCSGLISLIASTVPFHNLTTLDVQHCEGLRNLVSFSTAQSLVQLETMSITYCNSLTEVVGDERDGLEDEIVFKKLKVLKLMQLTKLTSFCSRLNFAFKFPCLERLVVRQCPNMETFCKGVLKTPMLQRISLNEKDEGRLVDELNSTINQFYEEMVGYVGLRLRHLKLLELHKLREIWNKNPQDILDFQRIRMLEICNCDSLRCVLTPSMVLSLSCLREIRVQNCEMIEQIITEEEVIEVPENKMEFPSLRSLTLKSCPNLTSFIVGSYKLEFLSLSFIEMANCPKMVSFSTFSKVQEKETIVGGSEERIDIPTEPFFSDQVGFPSLEKLIIRGMRSLIRIWDEQIDEDSFHKLYLLCVEHCEKLVNIFPVNMVERLQNLGELQIRNCVSLEEIFEPQGLDADESEAQITAQSALVETTPNFVFPKVTSLDLQWLPNLKCLYTQIHTTEWPSLKKLDMSGCDKVQILASELLRTSGENQLEIQIERPLFWVSKATFANLEELIVEQNDDLKEIWHDDVKNDIIFTKLKSLQIKCLPRLASFCLGNCNFEFSSLEDVIVMGCPNMMTFSRGEVRTPKLHKVKLTGDYEDEGCWEGGLNPTIQLLFTKRGVGDSKED